MSEHSNIDKIFKEGLGERKFSNADAMWQQMEADLDKEGGKKRRPFVLLLASAILIATAFFAVQHRNIHPSTPTGVYSFARAPDAALGRTTTHIRRTYMKHKISALVLSNFCASNKI